MGYSAKILLDSVNSKNGIRLTTFEITFPRFVLAEFNTHRSKSRNAASSRAIPASKFRSLVTSDPVFPVWWGKAQKGMQADEELCEADKIKARAWWLETLQFLEQQHIRGEELGVHKQILNRILECFQFVTVVVSATEFANFFSLRSHKDAQPEIKKISDLMLALYKENKPKILNPGQWHLPFVLEEDLKETQDISILKKLSAARAARVSYLTHAGKRDHQADITLHDSLVTNRHMSPFEHPAMAWPGHQSFGNFRGWKQYRKEFPDENVTKYP